MDEKVLDLKTTLVRIFSAAMANDPEERILPDQPASIALEK